MYLGYNNVYIYTYMLADICKSAYDMTCFLLLCIRYDTEVMFRLLYGYDTDTYIRY